MEENTLLERLLQAVDEAVLYRTEGKLQELKKVREEIRQKNELIAQTLSAFRAENINQEAYRELFATNPGGDY